MCVPPSNDIVLVEPNRRSIQILLKGNMCVHYEQVKSVTNLPRFSIKVYLKYSE